MRFHLQGCLNKKWAARRPGMARFHPWWMVSHQQSGLEYMDVIIRNTRKGGGGPYNERLLSTKKGWCGQLHAWLHTLSRFIGCSCFKLGQPQSQFWPERNSCAFYDKLISSNESFMFSLVWIVTTSLIIYIGFLFYNCNHKNVTSLALLLYVLATPVQRMTIAVGYHDKLNCTSFRYAALC